MMDPNGLTPTERELEMALAGLKPAGTSLDRDRVMFTAGQASIRRHQRLWQAAASLLAGILLISILSGPGPDLTEQPSDSITGREAAFYRQPIEPADGKRLEDFRQYVRIRRAVLDRGVDALPASSQRRATPDNLPLTLDNIEELL